MDLGMELRSVHSPCVLYIFSIDILYVISETLLQAGCTKPRLLRFHVQSMFSSRLLRKKERKELVQGTASIPLDLSY